MEALTAFALMVPQSDDLILIIKYCKSIPRDSWEWIFSMCWMYDPAPAAAAVTAFLWATVLRWFAGAR